MKQDKKALIIFAVIAAVFYVVSFGNFGDNRQKDTKSESSKIEQKTPEDRARDLEIKRQAEEKYAAERERSRQMEAERKRQQEAERAAREAQRAANRLSVEEFESIFLNKSNQFAQAMGIPFEVVLAKPVVRGDFRIYTLDNSAETKMIVTTASGGVKGVKLNTLANDPHNIAGAVLTYNLILQILTPNTDIDSVYRSLNLDETILDNLTKQQFTTLGDYRFSKQMSGKTLSLEVTEQ